MDKGKDAMKAILQDVRTAENLSTEVVTKRALSSSPAYGLGPLDVSLLGIEMEFIGTKENPVLLDYPNLEKKDLLPVWGRIDH